ncbi:unnamed protein product, partial [Sphacelaria rigidula]
PINKTGNKWGVSGGANRTTTTPFTSAAAGIALPTADTTVPNSASGVDGSISRSANSKISALNESMGGRKLDASAPAFNPSFEVAQLSNSVASPQGAQAQQSRGSSSQERKSKMPAASRSGGSSNAGGHGHHSKRNSGERVKGRVGRDGANWVRQNGYISPADAVQSEGGDEKRSAGVTGDGDGNASSSCGWRSNQRGMHQGEGLTRTATPLGLVGCTD